MTDTLCLCLRGWWYLRLTPKVTQPALGELMQGLPDPEAHVSFHLAWQAREKEGQGRRAVCRGGTQHSWRLKSLLRSVFLGCGQMFLSVFELLDMLRVTLLMARSRGA